MGFDACSKGQFREKEHFRVAALFNAEGDLAPKASREQMMLPVVSVGRLLSSVHTFGVYSCSMDDTFFPIRAAVKPKLVASPLSPFLGPASALQASYTLIFCRVS